MGEEKKKKTGAGNSRSVCLQNESKTPFIFEMEYGQKGGRT